MIWSSSRKYSESVIYLIVEGDCETLDGVASTEYVELLPFKNYAIGVVACKGIKGCCQSVLLFLKRDISVHLESGMDLVPYALASSMNIRFLE